MSPASLEGLEWCVSQPSMRLAWSKYWDYIIGLLGVRLSLTNLKP